MDPTLVLCDVLAHGPGAESLRVIIGGRRSRRLEFESRVYAEDQPCSQAAPTPRPPGPSGAGLPGMKGRRSAPAPTGARSPGSARGGGSRAGSPALAAPEPEPSPGPASTPPCRIAGCPQAVFSSLVLLGVCSPQRPFRSLLCLLLSPGARVSRTPGKCGTTPRPAAQAGPALLQTPLRGRKSGPWRACPGPPSRTLPPPPRPASPDADPRTPGPSDAVVLVSTTRRRPGQRGGRVLCRESLRLRWLRARPTQ